MHKVVSANPGEMSNSFETFMVLITFAEKLANVYCSIFDHFQ